MSTRVLDGDTVDLAGAGQAVVRVRVLGIDAPEVAHDGRPAECGGEAARDRLDELLAGRRVQLVDDRAGDHEDRYGRRLAYVETEGRDVGQQLVDEGLVAAWAPRSAAPPTRLAAYRVAQLQAQQHREGSWAKCRQLGR